MMNRILIQLNVLRQTRLRLLSRVISPNKIFQHYQDQTIQNSTAKFSRGISSSLRRWDISQDNQESNDLMASTEYSVDHDTKNKYFYIVLQDSKAMLEYDWISPTLVDMYHTEVPPQFQGKGIAKYLAKAAFDYFSEKEITMRPSCTYLQKYLRENPLPQYLDHVEKTFIS